MLGKTYMRGKHWNPDFISITAIIQKYALVFLS